MKVSLRWQKPRLFLGLAPRRRASKSSRSVRAAMPEYFLRCGASSQNRGPAERDPAQQGALNVLDTDSETMGLRGPDAGLGRGAGRQSRRERRRSVLQLLRSRREWRAAGAAVHQPAAHSAAGRTHLHYLSAADAARDALSAQARLLPLRQRSSFSGEPHDRALGRGIDSGSRLVALSLHPHLVPEHSLIDSRPSPPAAFSPGVVRCGADIPPAKKQGTPDHESPIPVGRGGMRPGREFILWSRAGRRPACQKAWLRSGGLWRAWLRRTRLPRLRTARLPAPCALVRSRRQGRRAGAGAISGRALGRRLLADHVGPTRCACRSPDGRTADALQLGRRPDQRDADLASIPARLPGTICSRRPSIFADAEHSQQHRPVWRVLHPRTVVSTVRFWGGVLDKAVVASSPAASLEPSATEVAMRP